jgi:hypothetical protein
MFFKIPVYVEISVTGDFDPNSLSQAVDSFVADRIYHGAETEGFPFDSDSDVFDRLARKVATTCGAKEVKINLVKRSQMLQKLNKNK